MPRNPELSDDASKRAAELVQQCMAEEGLKNCDMARRLCVRAPAVRQFLRADTSFTVRRLAQYMDALGRRLEIRAVKKDGAE